MPAKSKIIFLGDVVGSLGRQAVKEVLPQWQKKYRPDIVIANIENLAHGKGVTIKTLQNMRDAGVGIFTGGNHIWAKHDLNELASETDFAICCPANDSRTPQKYLYQITKINNQKWVVVALIGRTFMEDDNSSNPFLKIDKILPKLPPNANIIIDLHAEATSEKRAMGFYLDGKVSAVLGTHTHIPTADAQILPKGTGYLTDVGMIGPYYSVLGIKTEIIIDKFLTDTHIRHELPETGQIEINAVLLEIDNQTHHTNKIRLMREVID
ncbi:MAG: metallophosphoesterase [Candidatus Komeilibacteria bacterium CG11_big_fil_rev_8_21_14_0_20_36_20]|uniref:Metallophosphoesterase n=1 Tax=Candidatus Komeilibacteria bacterium CG11_big_fil_rev_8_21_14_0_20_36_20 TaxID=1974477 RepID=A0A2H0NEI2_9BACT|nr:MAG: metallophosphoesterase [Candidatus Komeilibacteria bacterium CG11_big_fil_rev_8_21_14_0_20_36_20]PIR81525.1 MAG: metallophosphoesterase [Candidatus Komeilibacteria bacterium CG10_big_fil_rev_8_21_14_0_10_36_65]PJC55264.1 MAG: metallophosphoesterase [Candidatus Komeilibacteria bacterium CG_4_9_14_0_2_um_filter_36_13]